MNTAEVNPSWKHRAACAQLADEIDIETLDEMFHPGRHPGQLTRYAIRQYCHRCPVARDCLTYALQTGSTGIWGGMKIGRYTDRDKLYVRKVRP